MNTTDVDRNITLFRQDPNVFFQELSHRGDFIPFAFPGLTRHFINSPSGVEHVLKTNASNYTKNGVLEFLVARQTMGSSLMTTEGTVWRKMRQLIQPSLHPKYVDSFASIITTMTRAVIEERWHAMATSQQPFDVEQEMINLTIRIMGKILFHQELSQQMVVAIGQQVDKINGLMFASLQQAVLTPQLFSSTPSPELAAALEEFDQIVTYLLTASPQQGEDARDLLSLLVASMQEDRINAQQLRNEVVTMLFTAYETTACVLSWAWYLLALHPEIEARLHDEIDRIPRIPALQDEKQLPYTRMVLDETLRFFPFDWPISRKALADDTITGHTVLRGDDVVISRYHLHRHAEWWPEPEHFDPERFTPMQVAARPRYTYIPFGGISQHQCPGSHFALSEVLLILVTIAQCFRIKLAPGQKLDLTGFKLRARIRLKMSLYKRSM